MRIFLFILLAGLAPPAMAGDPPRTIRVLIVDGFSNHDWRLTTRSIRAILEPTGLFSVDVSTSPPDASAPGWEQWRRTSPRYDVVIQTCNDINGGPSGRSLCRRRSRSSCAVAEACTSGIPATMHSGLAGYNDIIGIGWRKKEFGWALVVSDDGKITKIPPGEGENTNHGKRFDALVQRSGEIPSTVACHAPGSQQTSRCTTTSAVLRKMSMCSLSRANLTPDSTGLSNGRCDTATAACTHRLWGTCGAAMFSL